VRHRYQQQFPNLFVLTLNCKNLILYSVFRFRVLNLNRIFADIIYSHTLSKFRCTFYSFLKMKRLSFLLLPALIFSSCKKESDSASWDVNILAPLFKATLSVSDLVPDSLSVIAPDGAVTLVLDSNIYSTPIDSVFQIHDTLQSTIFLSPGIITLTPGFVFYSQPSEFNLELSNVELSNAIVKSGHARLKAKNHLATEVIYTFNIPKAILNGVPFQKIQTLAAAPPGGVTEFDQDFDISGYTIDLTGVSGTDYNNLGYTVVGETSPSGATVNVISGDTIVDVTSGFESLIPLYARGYLGQGSVSETGINAIGTGKLRDGTILLDSISATLTIKNSIGADAQALLSSMRSVNYRTGTTVSLAAPNLINHVLNLNRATESGPAPSPVNATYYSIQLDNTNSNIVSLIENLPEQIQYDLNINLNPLGNVSGHHDFLYTDDLFDANLKINFPLRFAANQLMFVDTQELAAIDTTADDNLGDGTFKLIANNGFPYQFELQLIMLNASNQAIDSLFIPDIIDAASMDGNFRAIGKKRTVIPIPMSAERRTKMLGASRIALRTRFSTGSYPQILQVYDDYTLDLKLVGDFLYTIR
jgi:hypothetical protein